ncbi:MAG: PAC2 family protein, partial [Schaalia georgiae]|nr:PAC2 family protein [Schaalia georgiae]
VEDNPEISHTVGALEEHYDAWRGQGGAVPLSSLGKRATATAAEDAKSAKDIGDVIEAYLAQVTRAKDVAVDESAPHARGAASASAPEEPARPDTLEDVLARVEARRRGEDGGGTRAPRHRA